MPTYIQKLIEQGEHQMLDFKFKISDSKKIARTLVASENGQVSFYTNLCPITGCPDEMSELHILKSEEEKYMIQTAADLYCQPQVNFQAKEWNINGKTVLEIIVPKSKYHKHKAPDHNNIYKVYIRVKDQNILADGILLKIWKYQNNKHLLNPKCFY